MENLTWLSEHQFQSELRGNVYWSNNEIFDSSSENSGVFGAVDGTKRIAAQRGVERLIELSNAEDVILKVYAAELGQNGILIAAEPLKHKSSGPTTLLDLIEQGNFNSFFALDDDSKKFRFNARFKTFLRNLINVILKESKEKQNFLKITPRTVVVTTNDKFKIFNLMSEYEDIEASLNSIKRTVGNLVTTASRLLTLEFEHEVLDFICTDITTKYVNRHPALLEKGRKWTCF